MNSKSPLQAEIVYVGKRDGKLFQSFDAGGSWKDITTSLPLHFTRFNEIRFVGSTVYVATDSGVLSSQTGDHWRGLTDGTGTRVVIDKLAVDSTVVYGAGDTGVYRLSGAWTLAAEFFQISLIKLSPLLSVTADFTLPPASAGYSTVRLKRNTIKSCLISNLSCRLCSIDC